MLRSGGATKTMKSSAAMDMSRLLLSEIGKIDTSKMKDSVRAEAAKVELAERLSFFLRATADDFSEQSPQEQSPQSLKSVLKQRAKIVLPHVLLMLLSFLYIIFGAMIFEAIEGPNEINLKTSSLKEIDEFRYHFLSDLMTKRNDSSTEIEYETYIKLRLDKLTKILYHAYDKNYVKFDDITNMTNNLSNLTNNRSQIKLWSFSASLFFSATAITAIGYGHLVPQTTEGRVMCLIFCLIGIPLVLVTIADLGRFLSDYIISVYKFYIKCIRRATSTCRRCCRKLKVTTTRKRSASGLEEEKELALPNLLISNNTKNGYKSDDIIATGKVSVLFVLIILISYTAFGAVIFSLWEDWSFFEGFFFCFTTVTTIGFGDIVPLKEPFLPLTLLYIFVGLIITTMCVDLVGSQYIREIHDFGRNINKITRAFAHFDGVHLGEIFGYVAFLQQRCGLTPEQLQKMSTLPEDYLMDCIMHGRQPDFNYKSTNSFIPNDIYHIKWIEQPRTMSYVSENVTASSETLDVTSRCSTARTPRDWYHHMIYEHKKEDKV